MRRLKQRKNRKQQKNDTRIGPTVSDIDSIGLLWIYTEFVAFAVKYALIGKLAGKVWGHT